MTTQPLAVPRLPQFRSYVASERLGAGGMAEVYRAFQLDQCEFPVEFVLKRLRPVLDGDPAMRSMFENEGRVGLLFRHPSLVRAFECGEGDDGLFIVLECVEGMDLLSLMKSRKRPLSAGAVALIGRAVASGLAYAHLLRDEHDRPLGIIHRDISPANIMVTATGGVKLLDFGIAKLTDAPLASRTLRELRRRPQPAPSALVKNVPAALDRVILRMLSHDPAGRFASCSDVVTALDEVLGNGPPSPDYLAKLLKRPRPTLTAVAPTKLTPLPIPIAIEAHDTEIVHTTPQDMEAAAHDTLHGTQATPTEANEDYSSYEAIVEP